MLTTDLFDNFAHFVPGTAAPSSNVGGSFAHNEMMSKVADQLGNPADISGVAPIKKALKRFPELLYHLGAIATFVSYTNQYPWVNKKVYGPGGISLTLEPRFSAEENLAQLVDNTLASLSPDTKANSSLMDQLQQLVSTSDTQDFKDQVEADTGVVQGLAHKLLEFNTIYVQLYKAANSLVTYSNVIVDFSPDWTKIMFYSLDEVVRKSRGQLSKEVLASLESDDDREWLWIVTKTNKILSEKAYVVTDGNSLSESPMGRVVHYLNVLDVLEVSLSVERLAKANSFVVWKVGVDGLPGEVVGPWLDTYRERVMSKFRAGTKTADVASASMSRSITASHVFVPNYKDSPTEVEQVNLEYRPLLDDIDYWWRKVFMALGIPPYYSMTISQATTTLSGDVTAFHESLLGTRVRRYQGLLEEVLRSWLQAFLEARLGDSFKGKYDISVCLPTYVSGGEESRSEYMKRINQFASAYSTLKVSGMPLNANFVSRLMFPNADPKEVMDTSRLQPNPGQDDSQPSTLKRSGSVDDILAAMNRNSTSIEG